MERKQKKRSRALKPGSEASSDVATEAHRSARSRRFWILAGACTAVGFTAYGIFWLVDQQGGFDKDLEPVPAFTAADTSPPLDPSEVLGLPSEMPDTVQGLKEAALQIVSQLVRDLPERPESYAVGGVVFKRFGNSTEASDNWRKCLELNPDFAPAHLGLGTVAAAKAQTEKAVEHLSKAIAQDANLAAAYSALTEVLLQSGQAEQALELADQYVARFPQSAQSHYWQGQAYLQLRRYDDATRSHRQALQIDPELTHSYHSLAIACMFLGETALAQEYREKFATLKAGDLQEDRGRNLQYRDLETLQEVAAEAYLSVGHVYLRFQDARKAEACWLRGSSLAPHDQANREALVGLYEDTDRLALAASYAQELVDIVPGDARYWVDLGRLHSRLGRSNDAQRAYRAALRADHQSLAAYRGLVTLYLQSEQACDDALILAEKALELSPTAESWVQLAAVRQTQGDQAGAVQAIKAALRLEPGNQQLRQLYEQFRK